MSHDNSNQSRDPHLDDYDPIDPLILAALREAAMEADSATDPRQGVAADSTLQDAMPQTAKGIGEKLVRLAKQRVAFQPATSHGAIWDSLPDEGRVEPDFSRMEPPGEVSRSTVHAQYSQSTKADERSFEDVTPDHAVVEAIAEYKRILQSKQVGENLPYQLERYLGKGGQGEVHLTRFRGADGFVFPAALKVFSPEKYSNLAHYQGAMRRIARVASLVARAHDNNLMYVHAFEQPGQVRVMLMEWVDGFDLRKLLGPKMLGLLRDRVSPSTWSELTRVVVTAGPSQSRLAPGVAVSIVRDCLAGLVALHAKGIVHGDVKPGNIMLRCNGTAKLVDFGSAFEIDGPKQPRVYTRSYAAPEVRTSKECTPRSDLASLGYVLIELLAGRRLFSDIESDDQLLEAQNSLPDRLTDYVPEDFARSEVLMTFCRRLVEPNPRNRFGSAEEAILHPDWGASAFHHELVRMNLAAVFQHDIHRWIEALMPGCGPHQRR